jgi:hypothetical protein
MVFVGVGATAETHGSLENELLLLFEGICSAESKPPSIGGTANRGSANQSNSFMSIAFVGTKCNSVGEFLDNVQHQSGEGDPFWLVLRKRNFAHPRTGVIE